MGDFLIGNENIFPDGGAIRESLLQCGENQSKNRPLWRGQARIKKSRGLVPGLLELVFYTYLIVTNICGGFLYFKDDWIIDFDIAG